VSELNCVIVKKNLNVTSLCKIVSTFKTPDRYITIKVYLMTDPNDIYLAHKNCTSYINLVKLR
jgi:hypothetical protein